MSNERKGAESSRRGAAGVSLLAAVAAVAGCAATLTPQLQNEVSIQLASRQPAMQACFKEALRRDANLAGSLILTFVVNPNGEFTEMQAAQGTISDARLRQCVLGATARLRLSRPAAVPIAVTYPLSFEPEPIPGP